MKKIFTLLAGFVMAVTAHAGVLYSWSSKTVTAGDEVKGVVTETGGTIEQVNGEGQINYRNGDYFTVCLSGKKSGDATYGSTASYMLINLEKPISEGSVLEIMAFRNKDTDAVGSIHMEFINPDAEKPIVYAINEGNNKVWNNIHANVGQQPNTREYELPESTIGATKILLTRDQASTNMFILSIRLTDPTPDVDVDKNVLVVSPLGEDDPISFYLQDGFVPDFVSDISALPGDKTMDDYDAILVSNKVKTDADGKLREKVAYFPMVNLSTDIIKEWNLGTVNDSETGTINISDDNLDNYLFKELSIEEGLLELIDGEVLPVVTPAEYLKNDVVLATIGEGDATVPYIFQHTSSSGKNSHLLIPLSETSSTDGDNMIGLIRNAINVVAATKKAVENASAPIITTKELDGKTIVTITSANGGIIRYVTYADDVETIPAVTEKCEKYTDPLEFNEPINIKAKVFGADGYYDSAETAPTKVKVYSQAYAPEITLTPGEGQSVIITMTPAQVDDVIHFSFAGQVESTRTDVNKTQVYTEPVTVYEPTTVYAFAIADGLPSELVSEKVVIPGIDASNIRLDEVSHFSAGDAWKSINIDGTAVTGLSKYYLGHNSNNGAGDFGASGNHKYGWLYWSEDVDYTEKKEQQAKDEDGNLKFEADGTTPVMEEVEVVHYKPRTDAMHVITADGESDWKLVSEGQLTYVDPTLDANSHLQDLSKGIDSSNNKPIGVVAATDLVSVPPTKGTFQWKGKLSGHPYNARIESTKAFEAPFDLHIFIRNGGDDKKAYTGKVLTSTDGKEWKELAEMTTGDRLRSINKYLLSVEDEGKYYVRVEHNGQQMQLHDIYVMNNGEQSKQYTGIEDVIATEGAEVIAVEYYNLNGIRIAEPTEGFFIKRSTLSNGQVVVEKLVK